MGTRPKSSSFSSIERLTPAQLTDYLTTLASQHFMLSTMIWGRAIARHPKTPDSALNNLVQDTHPVVRALAKANLQGRSA